MSLEFAGAPAPRPDRPNRTPLVIGSVVVVVALIVGIVIAVGANSGGGSTQTGGGGGGETTFNALSGDSSPSRAIPSNDSTGISDGITLNGSGTVGVVSVQIDIDHSYPCDLEVYLQAPSGAQATLVDRPTCDRDDPRLQLDLNSRTSSELAPLLGQAAAGTWTLRVVDDVIIDEGTLNSWSISVNF